MAETRSALLRISRGTKPAKSSKKQIIGIPKSLLTRDVISLGRIIIKNGIGRPRTWAPDAYIRPDYAISGIVSLQSRDCDHPALEAIAYKQPLGQP